MGVRAPGPARGVVEADQPGRRRGRLADADDPAEALGSEPALVPDRDVQAVLGAQEAGLLGQPLRVLEVGGDRGEHPGPPARGAGRDGAGQRRRHRVGVGQAGQHHPAHRRVLGRGRAPRERERAQHRAHDERLEPGLRRQRRDRGRDRGPVPGGAGQGGAGAAEVLRALLADPHEQDDAQGVVAGGAGGHRQGGHLAGSSGGPGEVQQGQEVGAERVGDLGGPGSEQGEPASSPHRSRAARAARAPRRRPGRRGAGR